MPTARESASPSARPAAAKGRAGRTTDSRAEWIARWTIAAYVVAAAFSLATWPLRHNLQTRSWADDIADVLNVPVSASLFGIVLLFLLAGALVRRKRFALWIVIALQAGGILLAIAVATRHAVGAHAVLHRLGVTLDVELLTYVGGAVALIAIPLLLRARPAFPARRSPGSLWAAVLVLIGGVAASVAIATLLAEAFAGDLDRPVEPVIFAIRGALGVDVAGRALHGHQGPGWITWLAGVMSAIAVLAAVAVFLRSGRGRRQLDPRSELAVRRLLATSDRDDSLGYFATRRDRSVVFSPDRQSAVSYRVVASVCLAAADPVGPHAAWPAAIRAWLAEARRYGWVPAVVAPGKEAAQAYVDAGLRAIPIGDEAVIEVDSFSLSGPSMKAVRQAVSRVRRAGYTVSVRRHRDIDAGELTELTTLAARWRGDAPERGFSMALSRLGDPVDGNCLMVVARTADGKPAGLLSMVPWGRRGVSLDLMRRSREAVNGVVEMMVTTLIERSGEHGVSRISLNFAMWRTVFADAEQFGAGPVTRLNNAVLSTFSRFFQIESLYRSNAKYLPQWVPRYLCIDSPVSLLRVAIAAGMAEGFLPEPGARRGLVQPRSSAELLTRVAEMEAVTAHVEPPPRRPQEQERMRRGALELLRAAGMDPYPVAVPRTGSLPTVLAEPDDAAVSVTGRVLHVRDHGAVAFADLTEDGALVQVVLDRAAVGDKPLDLWRHAVDRGDLVSVTGVLARPRRGVRTLLAESWCVAAKSLRPLPSARTGLRDPQALARDRSADLLVNAGSKGRLEARSVAVAALRTTLAGRGYAEVETPILQTVHGGATARPFTTHINAYNLGLSLRIAPELFLKRLVVGGLGPIFEIGRNFRNEGVDSSHNPEFTSLEAYQPWADYTVMRHLARDLILAAATAVHGAPVAQRPVPGASRPERVDIGGDWPVVTVHEAVARAVGRPVTPDTTTDELTEIAGAAGIAGLDAALPGELVLELYERLVEPATVMPTFYTDFPLETSPLTRPHRADPRLAERWDLVAFGMEIGTAYSELVDPVDQRMRLTAQSLRAAAGDPEAMEVDEEFLSAMELGMPPTGGLGLGVDRLVMMLTGAPIRGVLRFPFVRPDSVS